MKPGLKFCSTNVLRAGIVLVGFKLSLLDVASLTRVLPVVVSCIGAGIVTAKLLGRRLGVSEEMSSLIAAGTSICGVTAITSVSGAIRAKQQDVSFAVANVVAFGTLGMLAYPYAIPAIFHGSEQIGVFLGVAIHDTSQVMGSALTYSQVHSDDTVLKVAAITKLTRNLFLAGVVPYFSLMHARANPSEVRPASLVASLWKHTPAFVLAFVGAAAIRTGGDAFILNHADMAQSWEASWRALSGVSVPLLSTAMAGVGLSTSASALRGVGVKPFVVGLGSSFIVGLTGIAGIALFY